MFQAGGEIRNSEAWEVMGHLALDRSRVESRRENSEAKPAEEHRSAAGGMIGRGAACLGQTCVLCSLCWLCKASLSGRNGPMPGVVVPAALFIEPVSYLEALQGWQGFGLRTSSFHAFRCP